MKLEWKVVISNVNPESEQTTNQFSTPSENCTKFVFCETKGLFANEEAVSVWNSHSTIVLSAKGVVEKVLEQAWN